MSTGRMGWRPLARLAWREVARRKGRTALVTLLIALPVAFLTFMSVMVRTQRIDDQHARQVYAGPDVDRAAGQHWAGVRAPATPDASAGCPNRCRAVGARAS